MLCIREYLPEILHSYIAYSTLRSFCTKLKKKKNFHASRGGAPTATHLKYNFFFFWLWWVNLRYEEGAFKGGNGMQVTCPRLAPFAKMNFLVVGYIFGSIGFVASLLVRKFPHIRLSHYCQYDSSGIY